MKLIAKKKNPQTKNHTKKKAHLVTSFTTVSHNEKKKQINNFQNLPLSIRAFTRFNSE